MYSREDSEQVVDVEEEDDAFCLGGIFLIYFCSKFNIDVEN